ncbi:MAG TPA: hypothetical protein VLC09_08555, partial [Polyangiaceae bacterium]|nr:hypothetical protein [Polyangiaceae bacterium]
MVTREEPQQGRLGWSSQADFLKHLRLEVRRTERRLRIGSGLAVLARWTPPIGVAALVPLGLARMRAPGLLGPLLVGLLLGLGGLFAAAYFRGRRGRQAARALDAAHET